MKPTSNPYPGHRYPSEIISPPGDISGLAARGIVAADEALRQWWLKFGQRYANTSYDAGYYE